MTDYHVHIEQWFDTYYYADRVFAALKAAGTDEVWFSSTTSEHYCTESPKVLEMEKAGEKLTHFPTAQELYDAIKDEMKFAIAAAKELNYKAHPLYWVIPEIHKSSRANVTIEKAMAELPYEGFKLHPRGNVWDMTDERTVALADEVFDYAEKHNIMVLIHCGPDDFELPNKFESVIARHPKALTQLAHTRPLDMTLEMLKKYPNTICDTAFVGEDVQEEVRKAGFGNRMRFGTDFPITHYYKLHPDHDPTTEELISFLKSDK